MELWVRSQDKECLLKINRVDIDTDGRTIIVNGFETIIGIYKSKERALEILDEIQDFLSGREAMEKMNKLGGNMNNIFPTMIYIMPEE